jgi:hypothetical protein
VVDRQGVSNAVSPGVRLSRPGKYRLTGLGTSCHDAGASRSLVRAPGRSLPFIVDRARIANDADMAAAPVQQAIADIP